MSLGLTDAIDVSLAFNWSMLIVWALVVRLMAYLALRTSQLGATFDEDPEIGMYRYNYIEKDGYCRPLNDPSGLEHTDGITGFNASGAVTPTANLQRH